MTRRWKTASLKTVIGIVVWTAASVPSLWGPTSAADTSPGTTGQVPGTTLEAQARDDGSSQAPWLIGSGVAAVAAVVVGGTALRRRMQ